VPLQVGGDVIGALMIYAGEPDAFDAEELTLLSELARDLSFGIAVLRDHATMERQREQLLLFRQTIERHSDAIFIADIDSGRFVDFNEAALRQLGYSADEMRQIGPSDVVVDIGSRGGFAAVAANIKSAGGLVRTTLHRRKDGTEVPVEVALSLLEISGRQLVLGIARDVSDRLQSDSEREELQRQLNRAQKMESVGRLAGGVAHDFNNLLTVITATTDLALGEVSADSTQHHDLVEIRSAAERATALTRQLLAFSRQQVLKREVLDINDVVSTFLKMLSRVIGEDIHVELKLGSDVPSIVADAGQLEQVLMNLCVNARDAMPAGGTLVIGTGFAEVDAEHAALREGMVKGRYALLTVSDTGVGMDKATQAKIFDPFFTTKAVGRGTGLGLSTVYGIVKQSGGSIWVYSEPGRGTTFRIYLPITDEETTESSSAPHARLRRGEETILVVEDEESIRMVARRVLEREGYTVLEAASGPEAIALLERHTGPLHLVMTDLVMPGMTGIELAQRLAASHPTLKMLFTSGYSADVVSDRFRPSDEWNFIAKPYGVRELAAEVRRVLDA
jgi:two-component system, cell cycle sensor histidine kinase and response regulator CckA